ncbi:glycosyltransferase [Nitratireductor basaltis]|uniref:Mannosyl transferase n=1 Tax=Nitratireductor basaltis TaxID=472175 RepID=A0A084UDU9_9HYPH|nr:glycosyltransferase family 4 protein [Nitratireductor basaltis]KFB11135.1 Mannosyl transferase [Nitratireductor basaltis]
MHLVFATSLVPCGTPETGYEIANAAVLDALRRAGVKVSILGFVWPGKDALEPDRTVVLDAVDVTTDGASTRQKLSWLATAVQNGLTFASAKLRTVSPENVEDELKKLGPIDGLILNSVQFAGAFEKVLTRWPYLYIAHNVEHVSAVENAAAADSFLTRCLFRREARLLRDLERRLCEGARFVYTFAEDDREKLGVATPDRSAALPLVTRTTLPASTRRGEAVFDAALIGTWTWAPNMIGLRWFLDEVVPLLEGKLDIRIGGRAPEGMADRYRAVTFAGRVPDAQEFVSAAKVVPLVSRAGTGVQLKTIETFELGLPAVATTHSLRGIASIPDNCIRADAPKAFAEALLQLVENPPPVVDGSKFYQDQIGRLDTELARGLAALGGVRIGAAA